jgi:hypothetical protein
MNAVRVSSVRRRQPQGFTIEGEFAGAGLQLAGKDAEHRGLPGAVLTHESQDASGAKLQVDAAQDFNGAEALCDAACTEEGLRDGFAGQLNHNTSDQRV